MPLSAGDKAASFDLIDDSGDRIRSLSLTGQHALLYAYPAAMTPGCTTQACDFRDNISVFATKGFTVLGISLDRPDRLAKFKERDHLTFPLLSDPEHAVMAAFRVWGEKKLYGRTVAGVKRSTFVISAKGDIEHAFYNVNATGHVARLMRDLGLA